MSFDFALEIICPHQVVMENLSITNRMELRTISPLANSGGVDVYLNGYLIDKSGSYSAATVLASKIGYLDIRSGVNDIFRISVDGRTEQVITLKSGILDTLQISVDLNSKLAGASSTVSNGHIKVQSKSFGTNSRLKIGDGSANTTLGLVSNTTFMGAELYPGWNVISDPTSVDNQKMIRFIKPLKSDDNLIQVSYFTTAQFCRRCHGLKLENDYIYDPFGEKVEISDEGLMYQEIQKILFTIKRSNPFNPWYGTGLSKLVGTKFIDLLKSQILSEINKAFSNLKDLKLQQAQLQEVTPGEFPELLNVTKLTQDATDPTILDLSIECMSRRGGPIKLHQLISLKNLQTDSGLLRV